MKTGGGHKRVSDAGPGRGGFASKDIGRNYLKDVSEGKPPAGGPREAARAAKRLARQQRERT